MECAGVFQHLYLFFHYFAISSNHPEIALSYDMFDHHSFVCYVALYRYGSVFVGKSKHIYEYFKLVFQTLFDFDFFLCIHGSHVI